LRLTTSTGTVLEPLGTVATVEGARLNWTVTCLVPDGGEVITFDAAGLTVTAPEGVIRDNAGSWTAAVEGAELENRSLVDADGFTTERFARGAGGVTLYVSTRHGTDGRGLAQAQNPATPVKTLSRALELIAAGGKAQTGSAIRLLRGDVFAGGANLKVGGPDRRHPFVLEDYWHDYGDGRSDPGTRPIIRADWSQGRYHGLRSTVGTSPGALDNVVIRRLKIEAVGRSGTNKASFGLYLLAGGANWTIDDCVIHNFVHNIGVHGVAARYDELSVLRTAVTDAHLEDPRTPNSHTQGLFAKDADDILISQSLFDRNGWVDRAFTTRDQFSHNLYLQTGSTPSVLWGNVIRAGGSHGVQMRSGGILAYNYLGRNAIAAFTGTPGGAQIKNVVELAENLTRLPTGDGLEINPEAGDVTAMAVEFNIIVNSRGTKQRAITTAFKPYTIANATITHNTIVNGGSLYHIMPTKDIVPDDGAVRVEANLFDTGGKTVIHGRQLGAAIETWDWLAADENLLYNDRIAPEFQYFTGTREVPMDLGEWRERTGTEAESIWLEPQYVNPSANLASYSASAGGPATENGYITEMRQRAPGQWLSRFDMARLHDYYAQEYRITNAPVTGDGLYDYYGATDYRGEVPDPDPPVPDDPPASNLEAPDLAAECDSGARQDDNITYHRSFLKFVARNASAGTSIHLLRDGVVVDGGPARKEVVLWDRNALADGVYEYSVRLNDPGGVRITSPTTRVTVDTRVPVAPPAPDLLASSGTGTSGSDNVTTERRLRFRVVASAPEMTVELWRRPATVKPGVGYTRVGSRRGSGVVEDAGPIAPGTYRYVVCQVSVSGVRSGYSPFLLVTVA
jgi:hypothetical protein